MTKHSGGELLRYCLDIGAAVDESEMGRYGVTTSHDISCKLNTLIFTDTYNASFHCLLYLAT